MPLPLAIPIAGAAIAGAGMLGGILSGRSSRKAAQDQFDAQMDTSIQRRKIDAQKAGIHPLAALGVSSGASPTIHAGGGGAASGLAQHAGNLSRAVSDLAPATSAPNAFQLVQMDLMKSQAQGNYISNALAMNEFRAKDQALGSQGLDEHALGLIDSETQGKFERVRPEIKASKPGSKGSITAGKSPGGQIVTVDGVDFNVPSAEEPADAFSAEALIPYMGFRLWAYGEKKYGSGKRFIAKLRAALRNQRRQAPRTRR